MKRYVSAVLAAVLLASLTACGGGSEPAAQTTTSQTATTSSTPTPTQLAVPDVAGKTYEDASRILFTMGLAAVVVGKDGKQWVSSVPDNATLITATDPAAGTLTAGKVQLKVDVTEADKTAAAKLATRYKFICGPDPTGTYRVNTYHSLKEVWASGHYPGDDTCVATIDDRPGAPLLPEEQSIVDIVTANGGDTSATSDKTFSMVLSLCAKPSAGFGGAVPAKPEKAIIKAALSLCPDAPHTAMLQNVLATVKIADGTYTVGKDLGPGTYRTAPRSKDCYWSRTTGGGDIIANDFVGFAPDGVTVTINAGEGFESNNCGVWTKTG